MWIYSWHSYFKNRRRRQPAGFTLVELVVVVSIMVVLTSVFLLRQQRFNSSTLVRSLTYSIALSIRQAQVYGTALRESSIGAFDSGSSLAKAYGAYFSSGNPGSYVLFADVNNDGRYTAGEEVRTFTLNAGYSINKFCATTSGASPVQRCSDTGAISNLTIIFKRPNPDACFATSVAPDACYTGSIPAERYASAYIKLMSGSDSRSITVTVTGQIVVGAQGS